MKRQRLIVKIDAPIRSIRWNLVNRLLCLTVDPHAMVKNPTPEADNARIARNRKSHLQLELPSSKRPPLEEDDVPRVRGADSFDRWLTVTHKTIPRELDTAAARPNMASAACCLVLSS